MSYIQLIPNFISFNDKQFSNELSPIVLVIDEIDILTSEMQQKKAKSSMLSSFETFSNKTFFNEMKDSNDFLLILAILDGIVI